MPLFSKEHKATPTQTREELAPLTLNHAKKSTELLQLYQNIAKAKPVILDRGAAARDLDILKERPAGMYQNIREKVKKGVTMREI
jgi:hypothetical protein